MHLFNQKHSNKNKKHYEILMQFKIIAYYFKM